MGHEVPLGRRQLLTLGVGSVIAASLKPRPPLAQSTPSCAPPIPRDHAPANGGPRRLARCSAFHGMGTDNKGNRLAWGTQTTATLQLTNMPIIDQPRWPAMDAETTPAFMDLKVVFTTGDEPVKYEDASRQYRFEGYVATAQAEATLRVPSIGFTFKTDALETSKCDFAVIGSEVNGKYYV